MVAFIDAVEASLMNTLGQRFLGFYRGPGAAHLSELGSVMHSSSPPPWSTCGGGGAGAPGWRQGP